MLLITLLSLSCVSPVFPQVTQSSYSEESDEDLHQNQIPPPNLQPSEEDVKEAILQLIDAKIDKNADHKSSSEELSNWLQTVHRLIIADSVDRQWEYYGPIEQEVHSWEGYTPETKQVLSWESFKKIAYPDEYLDPQNPDHEGANKLLLRSERRWSEADLNSDTVLTKEEFLGFIHPEESEKLQPILVDEALEDMDADNDTFVTLDEYFKHLSSVMDEADKEDPKWKQVSQAGALC